jgi:hypothetical protein
VPDLDSNHRQVLFGECAEKPLRQRPSFKPDPGLASTANKASGSLATPHFPNDHARVIHLQTLVSLTDTSSPAKCSMLRFSF